MPNQGILRGNRLRRIGCLWLPDMPFSALTRADPELCGLPVAVVQGEGLHAQVVACSPEASYAGVTPGITTTAAQSLLSDLIVRPLCKASVRSAQAALLDVARSFSPRVALEPTGEICMDLSGLEQLFDSERKLGSAILTTAQKTGLDTRVGIGATKFCALMAARTTGGLQVVPAGKEREFLAPLPIDLLQAPTELHAALRRFGIEHLAELAALPAKGLRFRLGTTGLDLWLKARGEDSDPLVPTPLPRRVFEEIECDHPVDRIEPLLFVMRSVLKRLSERLEALGLAARALLLSLGLDPTGADERSIQLASPTTDPLSWLGVIKASLEKQPPRQAVLTILADVQTVEIRHTQLDLFARGAVTSLLSSRLDDTIARLAALSGDDRVGSPLPVNTHFPGEFVMTPFTLKPAVNQESRNHEMIRGSLLRAVRPAERVKARLGQAGPTYFQGQRFGGKVLQLSGPWRLESNWWQIDELNRDYYEARLSDGWTYRLYRDRRSEQWYVDGICE